MATSLLPNLFYYRGFIPWEGALMHSWYWLAGWWFVSSLRAGCPKTSLQSVMQEGVNSISVSWCKTRTKPCVKQGTGSAPCHPRSQKSESTNVWRLMVQSAFLHTPFLYNLSTGQVKLVTVCTQRTSRSGCKIYMYIARRGKLWCPRVYLTQIHTY